MSDDTRTEYRVNYPESIGGTEMNDTSGVINVREEAISYQRYIALRGVPSERLVRIVTFGEWEIDSD